MKFEIKARFSDRVLFTAELEARFETEHPSVQLGEAVKAAYKEGIRSFKRFDASRSKSAGGTGLGMSLMAGIAENLGGEVALSKSKLGGLAITLKLPKNS